MDLSELKENIPQAAGLLKSMANEDRLHLLCELAAGEKAVSELERLTGIRQPTLSQQLGVLRNEGLVTTRREGKWIFYSVASRNVMSLLSTLQHLFGAEFPRQKELRGVKEVAARTI